MCVQARHKSNSSQRGAEVGHSSRKTNCASIPPCLSDRHSEKQATGPEQTGQLQIELPTVTSFSEALRVMHSPVCLYCADKELRAIGVGACVRH